MTGKQAQSLPSAVVSDTARNYVGGEWRSVEDGDGQAMVDPATGETLLDVSFSNASSRS